METAKKRPNMLSATFVRTVKAPGRYGDGRGGLGMSLLVRTAARGHLTKCRTQSVRMDGRPTSIGLGCYPVVTLALARQRALENAQAIAEGRDPRRRAARAVPTFAEACETVIAIHAGTWKPGGKNEENWRSTTRDYVLPRLGRMPVDAATGKDVMGVLEPIWTVKRETARRVRSRIGAVMKWAVAQGYRIDNPAGEALAAALPNNAAAAEHRRALPHAEVRNTRWEDIDLDRRIWTVPAERMKAGREHRVPLSERALAVLDSARASLAHGRGIVFPSPTGVTQTHRPMGDLMRTLDIDAVPHGFRSSFRDWAAECTEHPARSANSPWRTSTATASRPPTGAATCSTAAAPSCSSGLITSLVRIEKAVHPGLAHGSRQRPFDSEMVGIPFPAIIKLARRSGTLR